MFNDEFLIGNYGEISIDAKRRMFIPASTGVEGGEKIAIKSSTFRSERCLKLLAYKTLVNYINVLTDKINKANTLEEYEKFQNMISEYCSSFEYLLSVDNQHRVVLPQELTDNVDIRIGDKVKTIGIGNALVLIKK